MKPERNYITNITAGEPDIMGRRGKINQNDNGSLSAVDGCLHSTSASDVSGKKTAIDDGIAGQTTFSAMLKDDSGCVFELNEVDWASVARAYKILRLYPNELEKSETDEQLRIDYDRWITMSGNRIEFEIAMRMCVEEQQIEDRFPDPPADTPSHPTQETNL